MLYLQPYSEEFVTIEAFGWDAGLPTYGLPTRYRLTTGQEAQDTLKRPRTDAPRGTLIDASRVLHIPGELRLDDAVYGLPYLEAVYNKLTDLLKVVGGGAEGFWRDARRRIALELQEGFEFSRKPSGPSNWKRKSSAWRTGFSSAGRTESAESCRVRGQSQRAF